MSAKILLLFGLICIGELASGNVVPQVQQSSQGLFAADLFKQVSKGKLNQNIIISPISIQAAMAMAFMGSEGQTATELQTGLRLSSTSKEVVGEEFLEVLKEKKGQAQLTIANKIYVNSDLKLRSTYIDLLSKYFNSEPESVNFSQSAAAVENVNSWIAKTTNNKIKHVLQPGSVDANTCALIVNAIYFKGKWKYPFSKRSTRNSPFWLSATESVDTRTMSGKDNYLYGEFPELGATGVEMPYKNSDLSMLILLPNERDGLGALEEKLGSVALNELSSRMAVEKVVVYLPKFKIDFRTSVNQALKAMGITSIFENADLSGIFEAGPPVKVSDVQHKAFISVNEAGSEAAAATVIKMESYSWQPPPRHFYVDHPFVYAIKSSDTIYFIGHYSKPKAAKN